MLTVSAIRLLSLTKMPKLSNRRFSDVTVQNAKPRKKPYEIRDGKETGLILRVQPSGTKTWYGQLRDGTRFKLGDAEKNNLTEARKRIQLARATNKAPVPIEKEKPKPEEQPGVPTLFNFLQNRYKQHYLTHHPKEMEKADRKRRSRYADVNEGLDYVGGLNNFAALREFDNVQLDHFDWDMLDRWIARRLKTVSGATVRRNVGALRTALNKAVEWKLIGHNPLYRKKFVERGDEPRTRYLSLAEEKELRKQLAHSEKYFQQMVLLALNTGMRRGELLKLRWGDVDLERGVLTVRADIAKSKKARHIPLNREARSVIESIPQLDKDRCVILYRGGQVNNITGAWRKLAERAGLEDVTFHDLRHTFASKLVQKGIPLYTVQQLLGHSDPKLTARYSHLAADHLRDAVGVL